MPKNELKILDKNNYLNTIKNSCGSLMFQQLWVEDGHGQRDVLENGQLSCALFVSSILKMFDLIKSRHATVEGLQKDLEKFGWQVAKKPIPGAIIFWEAKVSKQGVHKHVGFYLGQDKAVSNSTSKRYPIRHHWTYGQKNGQPRRRVENILVWMGFLV